MPGDIAIPFPLSSAPGASSQESGGRLINCSAEPLGKANVIKQVWRRRPGLTKFASTSLTPYRGGILVGNLAYIAIGNSIVTVSSGGVVTPLTGTLPGTGFVTFARDNETPTPSVQCVAPGQGAFSVSPTTVTSFNGGGNLPSPNCVCGQDSYFFWGIGDNRIFAAGPNSTTVNALTFTTIQSRNTGNLLRVIPYQGLLFCFATEFFEIWSDTANPFPGFPYSRYAVFDRGLLAPFAIAGFEDGFGTMQWVGNDGGVYSFAGGAPQKVSPPDLDRLVQAMIAAGTTASLYAFVYIENGKSFWTLSSPNWTWEQNLNTGQWNERQSLNAGLAGPWRVAGSLNAFGQWLVGDLLSDNILFIDPANQQEMGTPLLMRLESAPVVDFPNRTRIARADFNFVTGVGVSASTTQTGNNPNVGVSVSRDGGVTWDGPRIRPLGQAANSLQRVWGTRFGQSSNHGVRWRLDISDEIYAAFMNGTMSADPALR